MPSQSNSDSQLEAVATAIRKLDPDGLKTAQVLRDTIDQLYDGQRTGRYKWDQLYKTEKTHCGTLVEINLQREFKFEDGTDLDFQIAGVDVDCKYSWKDGGWMIPPEAVDKLCLVLCAEDKETPTWSMGLVRTSLDIMNPGRNRDGKYRLSKQGQKTIMWLFRETPLPPNVLLQLDSTIVDKIMSYQSGQASINELFRMALGRIIGRGVVATVAQQDDYMKRVRGNGGARTALKSEGILILGQYQSHCVIARKLKIPIPKHGESISVRVTPATRPGEGIAKIGNSFWRVAQPSDPIVPAPLLPKI